MSNKSNSDRLFFLDLGAGRVLSVNPDGSDLKTVLIEGYGPHPDGIAVDARRGYIYWTNMGADPNANDGSIERCDLDGKNRAVIIPPGGTHTPKQLKIDHASARLYWCDREGMRVMRSNLDGSDVETLVQTGSSEADRRDQRNWCVGIAVDADRGKIYWSQKGPDNAGQGRIFRAKLEIPAGQTAAARKDIELLFDRLPEPIDLELDPRNRMIYWTDRGNPPRGNSVNRAPMDAHRPPERLLGDLMEAIGLSLDLEGDRMFFTDLAGTLYRARLDGSEKTVLLWAQGNLSGAAFVAGLAG